MFLRYKTYFFGVSKLIFKSLAFLKTRLEASSSAELHIYNEVLLFIHYRLFAPRIIFLSKKLQYEQIVSEKTWQNVLFYHPRTNFTNKKR
jgi:hypothetical protein